MSSDPAVIATTAAWIATVLGVGLWLWGWVATRRPIRRLRLQDCGVVLLFSAILVRFVTQERAMTVLDWAFVVISPLFIGAALWRLSRTGSWPE